MLEPQRFTPISCTGANWLPDKKVWRSLNQSNASTTRKQRIEATRGFRRPATERCGVVFELTILPQIVYIETSTETRCCLKLLCADVTV